MLQFSDGDLIVLGRRTPLTQEISWFDEPKLCKDVSCSVCGFNFGHFCPKDKTWCCGRCYKPTVGTQPTRYVPKVNSIEEFGVLGSFVSANIENCKREGLKPFLTQIASTPTGFILFQGDFQVGKTYAACACLEEYRRLGGTNGYFKRFSDLFSDWKESLNIKGEERGLREKYNTLQFLILDDIGVREPPTAFQDFFYCLIDSRKTNDKLTTLLTTNLSNSELSELYGARILSRIAQANTVKFK